MEMVTVGEVDGGANCVVSCGTGAAAAAVELRPRVTADEAGDKSAEQHCEHFSIRGFVALVQKKDPKFCSLSQIFHDQKNHDKHHNSPCPILVANFRRWDCLKCLDNTKNSDHRTASGTVSLNQDGASDSCSISFVRSFDPKRLFPCTQQSSEGKNAGRSTLSKSAQESNSKHNSPPGKGVTEVDTDPPTKDLQGPLDNPDVTANSSDNASMGITASPDGSKYVLDTASVDVTALPELTANISENASVDGTALLEVTKIRENEEGNHTEILCDPEHSEVILKPNADENEETQEILIVDCNRPNVSKPISGQKGDQICRSGPSKEAASKRSVESASKKKKKKKKNKKKKNKKHNKPSTQVADPDVENCEEEPDVENCEEDTGKTRLLSDILNTDQVEVLLSDILNTDQVEVGGPRSDIEVDHEKVTDLCEDDKNRDDVIPDSHQTVGEIRSKTTKNKTKYKGVDFVDDGSSLMNWLKKTHKKLRTATKESLHKDFDSCSSKSKSTVDLVTSKDMHDGSLSSVGNLSKKKVPPTVSIQQGDENVQSNNLERNMQMRDDMRQIEFENTLHRCLSKVKTDSLSKRKMPSAADAEHGYGNTENNTGKRTTLRTDDQCQMEPENSMQSCSAKVYLGKRDIQNVVGYPKQKLPKKRRKQKPEPMPEKETIMDDIPMDVVELLARNQHERQLMTEADSFDISHTQSKITADDDCPIVAAEDGPNFASPMHDTNFQQTSCVLESKKALEVHVASSIQSTSTSLQVPGHLKSTQEKQPHLPMEEEVTIAASSPVFAQHNDQYITEAPVESWNHKGTRKLMWDSFETVTRDPSMAACGSQLESNIRAVDLSSTHVRGSSNFYPTQQTVITALDHCTKRSFNQVQARSFPSAISTMEAGNLYDGRNVEQSGFYQKETMPATHLLRLMHSSTPAGFPNYGTSNGNQMEFPLCNSQHAYNQYRGSTCTSYGNNLTRKVPLTLEDVSRHKLQPLALEDLSRHQLQPNLQRPLRPHARVGVLGSFLQEEISNWSENCGTQSGYRIGLSKGISSFDMNKRENFETLNSGMFSARWNTMQLGSVSPSPEFLSTRNGSTQSWNRSKGKMAHTLDRFVKQDICVTNRNPFDLPATSINEYMRSC